MPLCIVETMLGHHYPNADKSQQLVNYVEDYLECVESLPLDIQRNVSLLREIDAKYQGIVFTSFFNASYGRVNETGQHFFQSDRVF